MRWEGFKFVKIKFLDRNNFVQFKAKFELLNSLTIRQIKMNNKTIYMCLSDTTYRIVLVLKYPKRSDYFVFVMGFIVYKMYFRK